MVDVAYTAKEESEYRYMRNTVMRIAEDLREWASMCEDMAGEIDKELEKDGSDDRE